MADMHPLVVHPIIKCGRCHHPLVFPLTKKAHDAAIESGQEVLGECIPCCVAVKVPSELFRPSATHHAETTEARPWPKDPPKVVYTPEQLKALRGERGP